MTPASLLEELLRYRSAPAAETAQFAALTHDDVCRAVHEKINKFLGAFEKYRHIAYVVQGPRDSGVDVLLKGSDSEDSPERYIALQIKSHAELEDRKNELAQKLKSGYFDARNAYPSFLERYYIILCGDSKKHWKRITAITNEFAREGAVRVIGPREAHAFIHMPVSSVAAVVDRHLSEDDYVRKQARMEVAEYDNKQLFFLLACICGALEDASDELTDDFFATDSRMSELQRKFGYEAVAICLDQNADGFLESYASRDFRRMRLEMFPAIRALYFDLQVRYDEEPGDLFQHLYEFLKELEEGGSASDDRDDGEER
jgi:hypothetical protein